jgi:hypothetical protein
MKLTQLTVAALFVGMTFVACEKDTKLPATTKKPVTATENEKADDPISNLFRQTQAQNTQAFQFNASDGEVFHADGGTTITVQPGALTYPDGTPATGMVTGRLIEVLTPGAMMTMGFPTQNAWSQANPGGGGPIQTAGAVQLTITDQTGVQLTAAGNGVTIGLDVDPAVGFDPNMRVWRGVPSIDQPRDNVWAENANEAPEGNEQEYRMNWMGRNRLNCDALNASCPGPTTPFRVDLPAPYVRSNTEIYVLAQLCNSGGNGQRAVFALDMYNPSPKYWYEHTAAGLTIGVNVYFVAVAVINGQMFYKIENATIVPNHFQHMNGMMPIGSAAALAAIVDALP